MLDGGKWCCRSRFRSITTLTWRIPLTSHLGGHSLGPAEPNCNPDLQRGSKKAKFRIAWIRQLAPNEIRAGVECLHDVDNFWGVNLSDREGEPKKVMQAFLSLLSDGSKTGRLRR